MTPIEFCKNKLIRNTATFYYSSNGSAYWLHEGQKYSDQEFEEAYPIDAMNVRQVNNFKGINPDRTKAWAE